MTITPEQRELRRQHIGASDAPAILGVCPFRTAYDVWLSKVMSKDRPLDSVSQRRIMVGNILEDGILRHVERTRNIQLERSRFLVARDGVLAANFDGYSPNLIVECKTTSMRETWQAGIPKHVMVQVQHQLYVADQEQALVCTLFLTDPVDYAEFPVKRDDSMIELIVSRCHEFWERYVLTRKPPPRTGSYGLVDIDVSLIRRYLRAKEARREAANLRKEILEAMGNAERAHIGPYDVVRVRRLKRSIDTALLKEVFPEIASQVTREQAYEVLNVGTEIDSENESQE